MSSLDLTYLFGGGTSIVVFFVVFIVYARRRKPEPPYRPGETSARQDHGLNPIADADDTPVPVRDGK